MATLTTEYLDKLFAEQTKGTFKLLSQIDQKVDFLAEITAKEFNEIGLICMRIEAKIEEAHNRIQGLEASTSTRFRAVDNLLAEITKKLDEISKQSLEDTYIEAKDILNLKKRVTKLESRLKKLEPYREKLLNLQKLN